MSCENVKVNSERVEYIIQFNNSQVQSLQGFSSVKQKRNMNVLIVMEGFLWLIAFMKTNYWVFLGRLKFSNTQLKGN